MSDKRKHINPRKALLGQNWSEKYGEKHRWQRITSFPPGIVGPTRIRVYRRSNHFLLQWWQPSEKKNLSERVEGDLVAAISRAREIEERLNHFKTSGLGRGRIPHRKLVKSFVVDLHRRADAGEIDPGTVTRYESALSHFSVFAEQPAIETAYPSATNVDRQFALQFAAYLTNLQIAPNGHPHSQKRRMTSTRYVQNVVRSLFHWAANPDRGNLMPDGFRNPFVGQTRKSNEVAMDLFGQPDITTEMAVDFLSCCDCFQLPLFSLLIFYGLRASEPCFLFRENLSESWLKVACDPKLGYLTKGRRSKNLPLLDIFIPLLKVDQENQTGLLFVRREIDEQLETVHFQNASLAGLRNEYEHRCQLKHSLPARERIHIRDQVLRDAGTLNYDQIHHEFNRISRSLGWPQEATLKDFRHLFSTEMQNGGMPEFYRRYLLGHSPGKAAVVNYTHLNRLRERYEEAVSRQFQPLIEAVVYRSRELDFSDDGSKTPIPEINENAK